MTKTLIKVIQDIRSAPFEQLDHCCPRLLSAWFAGYRYVDGSATQVWRAAESSSFPRDDNTGLAERAVLAHRQPKDGFEALLDALEFHASSGRCPVAAYGSDERWVKSSEVGLRQKPEMILGMPFTSYLVHQIRGYHTGLDNLFPHRAKVERAEFSSFERWLQIRYTAPSASWGDIVRVFYGEGREGINGFLSLWDEFQYTMNLS